MSRTLLWRQIKQIFCKVYCQGEKIMELNSLKRSKKLATDLVNSSHPVLMSV